MFNTPDEKDLLVKSLVKSGDVAGVLEGLDYVIENHTPLALYIATADRSNCMWIFDPETVYEMLGGQDIHDKTFRSVFNQGWEQERGILFYVLQKIGPAVVVRLSDYTLSDVRNSLKLNIPHGDSNSA